MFKEIVKDMFSANEYKISILGTGFFMCLIVAIIRLFTADKIDGSLVEIIIALITGIGGINVANVIANRFNTTPTSPPSSMMSEEPTSYDESDFKGSI